MNISDWSLEKKVGQLVVGGFSGREITEEVRSLVQEHHAGGVILFSRSIGSLEQLSGLTTELQELAGAGGGAPLLIAIDQEGGQNIHVREGVTLTPGNMALGAAGDEEGVYQAARISGQELRALGINVNYAPDVDVNNNPLNPVIGIRSYGEDPQLVGRFGAAAVRGFQDEGITATAKHFPGHGDTSMDSHIDLPTIRHSMERLESLELVPFQRAIEAGVDMIMTAHIVFSELEPEGVPATLSHRVVTGLLRERLQFAGVITTDCLEMKAIADRYGPAEGAVRALEAGVDLVLVSHTYAEQVNVITAILEALKTGRLTEERIELSVRRILAMKERRRMGEPQGGWPQIAGSIGLPASRAVVRELAERSVTLVKDEGVLPLDPGLPTLVVRVRHRLHMGSDDTAEPAVTLASELAASFPDVQEVVVGAASDAEERSAVTARAGAAGQVVVLTSNALYFPEQAELVAQLGSLPAVLVAASMRSPYDLAAFPDVPAYLACYEDLPNTLRALAGILAGRTTARGRLPVTL
ncbi:beta-N-acetylhexosaminidase [Paenibacillus sp. S150]|uniref:beta-N-acetylhexosaminidase n=1 Tax=Paenibacillus sp. S150 TaxID=2749826 RepID=UPI001C56095E|nr:beta-N-acetylhexosaminidase [Paenibacillus sp. S150]MBW4080977.1 beta-N-acetylhexosaminidase [Paenibacillus sp. S150]